MQGAVMSVISNMASISTSSAVFKSGLLDWRVAFNLDLLNVKYLFSKNKGNLKWYGDFESLQELFDHRINNGNELDRTIIDNLSIISEEIKSIKESLDQKINIALYVCSIKEADNLKSLLSRNRVNHITEKSTILKAENAALREKVYYTTLVISDLNTKLKFLEDENKSYATVLNILQVNEL